MVEDAMQQVLDAFKLLAAGSNGVVWRLVSATTNSPFTVVAEADDSIEAATQAKEFAHSLRELHQGRFPEAWKRPELQVLASNFLVRSADAVARTEVQLRDEPPIFFTSHDLAPLVSATGLLTPSVEYAVDARTTKTQVGSIEGTLIEVTTWRGKPALRVRERKAGRDITCVLPDYLAQTFSDARLGDVWSHRRVTVRGMIFYSRYGIARVDASAIKKAPEAQDSLPKLQDPNFTGGLSAVEYLERFRAGEIG